MGHGSNPLFFPGSAMSLRVKQALLRSRNPSSQHNLPSNPSLVPEHRQLMNLGSNKHDLSSKC
jgi:hypothetical protein